MTIPNVSYEDVLTLSQQLHVGEQLRLLEALTQALRERLNTQPQHSIMELKGLGKEIWQEIDVDAYVEEERASWDGR